MNKKIAALTLVVGAFLMISGCTKTEPKAEHAKYTTYGRYYTNIELNGEHFKGFITNDGMAWEYNTDTISDRTPTDGMPIWVAFDDNGTPNNIDDDVPLGLVYDRNTAIYDDLESALSDNFELERNGNNIHIGGIK